jgi:murein DD-endopeptidase MepM/ murein hydrolase activator NlpD
VHYGPTPPIDRMKQDYFILVLAHSLHGRLQRVHIPHRIVYGVLALAVFGAVSLFGFVSSYARMAFKVANYNALRSETEHLRTRYERLQNTVNQTNAQMASLQMLAQEVSMAYGMKAKLEGPDSISAEARLSPTVSESIAEYNFLRNSKFSRLSSSYTQRFHTNTLPSQWPLQGRLMGGFGERQDPFSGEGAYHTGVDISAPIGTPVHSTADGRVQFAGSYYGYGRMVIVNHGNKYETYYAHLSSISVVEGQELRRGEEVGKVGMSGRSTGPHLHYEVRLGSAPLNPYRFLNKPVVSEVAKSEFPF